MQGNQLCTTDDGCKPVLADGRFLHVMSGEPPRFSTTFTMGPPGGYYTAEPMKRPS